MCSATSRAVNIAVPPHVQMLAGSIATNHARAAMLTAVQADAYVEGRADGEACRYRVQAVRAVEVAVLKRIYYVEAAAPRQYQQRPARTAPERSGP